jgi:1,4-alpha-glucan branching enzyme
MVTVSEGGCAEFRFFRPGAASVFLVGDFNDWRTDQIKMVRQQDGYWLAKVPLDAGDYKFRYIADGLWYTDFAASGVEPGDFGLDSLLRVPGRSIMMPAQEQEEEREAAKTAVAAA